MSVAVYEEGLRGLSPVRVRHRDGSITALDVGRWHGPARGADSSLLERIDGATLDIGCGPGRLVAALAARGLPALGIDIAAMAVGLTRRAGARALQLSVFDDVPGTGEWAYAVLADGNIGIGGDPLRLLLRVGELLAPGGKILLELGPPASRHGSAQIRLENAHGAVGSWFEWASVASDRLEPLADSAHMSIVESWTAPEPPSRTGTRWFAALACR